MKSTILSLKKPCIVYNDKQEITAFNTAYIDLDSDEKERLTTFIAKNDLLELAYGKPHYMIPFTRENGLTWLNVLIFRDESEKVLELLVHEIDR